MMYGLQPLRSGRMDRARPLSDFPQPSLNVEREQWLRVTLSSIGDGVITTDVNGNVTFLNAEAERLTGWPAARARGQPIESIFRIVNEETRLPAENPTGRVLQSGLVVGLANHTLLIAADGTERPIDDSAAPIRSDENIVVGVVLVFRDVTERRRSETALRESEEWFRLLVESVVDYAIFPLDATGHVVGWNRGAERIKGYSASEIVGRHFSIFYPPEDLAAGKPQRALVEAQQAGRVEDEGWRVRKDGSRFWANVVITALRDADGRLRGFSKVTRDLTARKRAEDDRVKLERSKAQAEVLTETNRRKDEFLAMLSHELRNPLAALSSAAQLLRVPDVSGSVSDQAHGIIERQMAQLTVIVNDLLEVSRITTGRVRLHRVPMDVRELVEQAVETLRGVARQQEVEVRLSLPAQPAVAAVDGERIVQVISNLLNNAIKYTPQGGRVEATVAAEGDTIVVSIRDNGAGISAELLPHVFELFLQGDATLDRAHGGLGVGLTVVERLVTAHEGTVEAASAGPGMGSLFTVRLKSCIGNAATLPSISQGELQATEPRRVLVVDDNADAGDSLAMWLHLQGHTTRVAYSGAEALAAAQDEVPDVALIDLGMPVMSGLELAQRFREHPDLRRVVLVAVSGYGLDRDRANSREAGFDYHLVKPVDRGQLSDVLGRTARKT